MSLVRTLKSGEASVFADGMKILQLKVENKKIDVNLMNKELLKDVLRVGAKTERKSLLGKLKQLKDIAEELKNDGLTITISHKGDILFTLGSGAKSTLSKLVTRTNAIEINDLSKLLQLLI